MVTLTNSFYYILPALNIPFEIGRLIVKLWITLSNKITDDKVGHFKVRLYLLLYFGERMIIMMAWLI
jgi:hypothetical protein